MGDFETAKIHLLTQLFASAYYRCDYLKTNMSCECPLVALVFYRYIPKYFVDIVKVTYPWYKCDFAPNLTGIPHNIIILAYMEDHNESFFEIRVNSKHRLNGLMGERGVRNYNYRLDQII